MNKVPRIRSVRARPRAAAWARVSRTFATAALPGWIEGAVARIRIRRVNGMGLVVDDGNAGTEEEKFARRHASSTSPSDDASNRQNAADARLGGSGATTGDSPDLRPRHRFAASSVRERTPSFR